MNITKKMNGNPVRISPDFDELTKYGIGPTKSQIIICKQWPQIVDSVNAITLNATIKKCLISYITASLPLWNILQMYIMVIF